MKRSLIVRILCVLMCAMMLLPIVACQEEKPPVTDPNPKPNGDKTPCTAHTDANKDGKCDNCGADVEVTPPACTTHTDANEDGKCDNCGATMPEPPAPSDPRVEVTPEELINKMMSSIYTENIRTDKFMGLSDPSVVGINKTTFDEVLYPVPADSEFAKIYNVTEYGITTENDGDDNSIAMKALITELKKQEGLKKVMFPAGVYKFKNPIAIDGVNDVYFCSDSPDKQFEILMTSWSKGIDIKNCKNIHFNNYDFDYEIPSIVTGNVVSCDLSARQVVIKIDEGYDLTYSKYNGGKVSYGSYMEYTQDANGVYYPNKNGNLLYNSTGDQIRNMENGKYNASTGELTLTFKEGALKSVEAGVKVNVAYTMYEYFGFYASECEDIYLESINFYHTMGMAMGMGSTKNIYLNRVKLSPREGSNRLMTATADGFHPGSCWGEIIVTNSVFEASHDDCMNIKGAYSAITSFQLKKFVFDGSKSDIKLEAGDTIDLYEVATFKYLGSYTVKDWDPVMKVCEVKERIDQSIDFKGALVCNSTKSPSLTIKNTFFGNKRNRGMLVQCREVEISNCTFQNFFHGAIQVLSVADIFAEGIMPRNVTVKNNKFINCSGTDVNVFTYGPQGTSSGTITGIKVENNFFGGSGSTPIRFLGVGDSSVTNNCIYNMATGVKRAILIQTSEDVIVKDNYIEHTTTTNEYSTIVEENVTNVTKENNIEKITKG